MMCLALLKRHPDDMVATNLLMDVAHLGDGKASKYIRNKVIEKIKFSNRRDILDILEDTFLKFIELEELETLFEKTPIEHQLLLKKINALINRKRIINKMKERFYT